jgi:KRAB domain-containing zinc finger protein
MILENYSHLTTLGLPFTEPKVISLLQQGEDHWKAEKERLGDSALGVGTTITSNVPLHI